VLDIHQLCAVAEFLQSLPGFQNFCIVAQFLYPVPDVHELLVHAEPKAFHILPDVCPSQVFSLPSRTSYALSLNYVAAALELRTCDLQICLEIQRVVELGSPAG
jgi:hypothetical protein